MRKLIMLCLMVYYNPLFGQTLEQHKDENEHHRSDLFKRDIKKTTFIPKGQWLVGTTFKYKESSTENFKFLMMEDWTGNGYNFDVSPFVAYFLRDDFAVGARFTYTRNFSKVDDMKIKIDDDVSFTIQGQEEIAHTFYSTVFMRHYLTLGNSKRFALFNEIGISYGYGESKSMTHGETPADTKGTYSIINEFNIGVSPGMVAFINDNVALEVMIGIMGFSNKWVQQIENQVEEGWRRTSNANFNIDIFSLNIGLAFYI
ncbi:hypothetical protein [Flammeovirga sp. SJP92]|uniref:hypothetical protein n=1 Tax=Flammeovirga sp. SJP92 TaxID=1775430 RepID=UPI0012F8C993|nr:hypothetical protein [Flammeovirga sp. SJP92]